MIGIYASKSITSCSLNLEILILVFVTYYCITYSFIVSVSVAQESGSWVSLYQSEVAQLCPTLWDSMDCSPPGSSVHGIFQARILGIGESYYCLLTANQQICEGERAQLPLSPQPHSSLERDFPDKGTGAIIASVWSRVCSPGSGQQVPVRHLQLLYWKKHGDWVPLLTAGLAVLLVGDAEKSKRVGFQFLSTDWHKPLRFVLSFPWILSTHLVQGFSGHSTSLLWVLLETFSLASVGAP